MNMLKDILANGGFAEFSATHLEGIEEIEINTDCAINHIIIQDITKIKAQYSNECVMLHFLRGGEKLCYFRLSALLKDTVSIEYNKEDNFLHITVNKY